MILFNHHLPEVLGTFAQSSRIENEMCFMRVFLSELLEGTLDEKIVWFMPISFNFWLMPIGFGCSRLYIGAQIDMVNSPLQSCDSIELVKSTLAKTASTYCLLLYF